MDKREMELLMDRYKKEMLEFSKKNSTTKDAAAYPYSRDRSDPLPEKEVGTNEDALEAASVQSYTGYKDDASVTESDISDKENSDIADVLRKECEKADSSTAAEQKRRCKDINDFLAANSESGTLRIDVFASDRVFGISSARVMIFVPLESGNVTVYDGLTDISGSSDTLKLPAPPKSLSLSPSGKTRLPYAAYTVYVEHPEYVRAIFNNVPVFSGVGSIQPVRLLAKVDGTQEPLPIVVDGNNETTL